MATVRTVERTLNRRFPFRIAIEQHGRLIAAFRTQTAWPGPGQQIFCLRERELDGAEPLEAVERVPVAHMARVGRKLTIVLDRPNRKRCEFLVVQKERADGSGRYEQIFFRTETGIRAHRSRTRLEVREAASTPLHIVIDSGERYPWRFPDAAVTRRKLAVGDYALVQADHIVAVVERKSFDNLLTDVGSLQALHPSLPIIFAGNRKLANIWVQRFFAAVAADRTASPAQLQLEVAARYDAGPRKPGLDERIREAALRDLGSPFSIADLAGRFPEVPPARLRRVIQQLKREGLLERVGAGRGARWRRVMSEG